MAKTSHAGAANTDVAELLASWGEVVDPELLIMALTHRSFANELDLPYNNERLEFLGDAVLAIIVTDDLYHRFPDVPESFLARVRTGIVSQKPLAQVARKVGLGPFLLLGVGENKSGGRDKPSILSDTLEALIGATYLSNGLEPTREVVLRHLGPIIAHADEPEAVADWKTPLRKLARDQRLGEVVFRVEGTGPDHDRRYEAQAVVGERVLGEGSGPSKKAAENDAARVALESVGEGGRA